MIVVLGTSILLGEGSTFHNSAQLEKRTGLQKRAQILGDFSVAISFPRDIM